MRRVSDPWSCSQGRSASLQPKEAPFQKQSVVSVFIL
jgi:hypothetical protein